MSDPTDAPLTTGRRTWRLVRTLALPWAVCGGLLWALIGLTPAPSVRCVNAMAIAIAPAGERAGSGAELGPVLSAAPAATPSGGLPALFICWNGAPIRDSLQVGPTRTKVSDFERRANRLRDRLAHLRDPLAPRRPAPPPPLPPKTPLAACVGSEALGAFWRAGGEPGDRYLLATVSLWWLIPFPLLWSGFNLWRWVRPRDRRPVGG
ncbi:hypothetical protein [Alienimonas sp. DA493]|uniref:hypothetical protein n=1 Tax=Alienimonas sp. DA493 TaxID=3373605 RepID=UPI003754EF48